MAPTTSWSSSTTFYRSDMLFGYSVLFGFLSILVNEHPAEKALGRKKVFFYIENDGRSPSYVNNLVLLIMEKTCVPANQVHPGLSGSSIIFSSIFII